MVMASFHFHEELNSFLPVGRRNCTFSVPCAQAATTKHMIEALGIPHTEVGQIFVNGIPADFARLLQEGDLVTVFPHRTPPSCQREHAPRFIADAHLGGLARLLRMAGFDTLYRNDYGDHALAEVSVREQRILLTRDRELLKLRSIFQGCFVHALKPPEQFLELLTRLNLVSHIHPFTRCLECNARLHPIDKQAVFERLPPSVRVVQEQFTICTACNRIYWRGSHWQRMQSFLRQITNRSLPNI